MQDGRTPIDRAAAPGGVTGAWVQGVLDAVDAGVIVHDDLGRIVAHNARAAELLGRGSHELLGASAGDPGAHAVRSDGSELACEDYPVMVALRTGEPVTDVELGVRRPDGTIVWLLASARPANTHPRQVVATLVDVSLERSAERALQTTRAAEQAILRASDADHLLHDICSSTLHAGGHELVAIVVANDDEERTISVVAAAGAVDYLYGGMATWSAEDPRGRGPFGTALREQHVVVVEDVETDPHFAVWRDRARSFGFGSSAAIPFRIGGQRAALGIYAGDARAFDGLSLDALSSLGQTLEHALANLRRRRQLETAYEAMVTSLSYLSEVRDPYTSGHQARVADLAVAIGERLGLGPEVLWSLRLGGLVHDIGKTMVPSEVLNRPGRLDPIEFALVQRHTTFGEDVLRAAELPWPIPEIAAQHHERIDGSGYPRGLRGDEICLPARIVAVADVVEAMAHHRPYRPGLGLAAAIGEITAGAGTAFDPDVVAATCALLDDGFEWGTTGLN